MTVIGSNISALRAQNASTKANDALSTAMNRLSTGMRINSAKDDAAGLAISASMTAQIRGMNQGVRNANDGISMAQTGEGALDEVNNMLQRMRELAVQSANGTYSTTDAANITAEQDALSAQIGSIITNTAFNGKNLFATASNTVSVQAGANTADAISVDFTQLNAGISDHAFLGNEPTLHTPYLYDWLGKPAAGAGIVRRAMFDLYAPTPGGFPGNDDAGSMSAWWVFGALGMHPSVPGAGVLTLGSPLFPRMQVKLGRGTLDITAPRAARGSGKSAGPPRRETLILATNLLDLPAELVAVVYRHRWAVELFFRFFKQALGCRHLLSDDPGGVSIQCHCAVIACMLLTLWTGKRADKATWRMAGWFLAGLADEADVLAHASRPDRTGVKLRAKEALWKKLGY